MRIELNNVVPGAFRELAELDSEIWGTQVVFDRPGFYQVWAPSGRGKTTFAHVIYGLRRDYAGTLSIQGHRAADIATDYWAELRQRHFTPSIDKRCDQISFGEQQRVAVVRAMAQPFEWLLLDEPFSHLDSENVEKVSRLITRQCQLRGAGCLLMTLDQSRRFDFSQTFRL